MTVGNVARSSGVHHDSAAHRLDEALARQGRLITRLAPTREQTCAKERLSAGRAGVASRDQWLHWIDEAESLEPWADGEWAPTHTLMAVAQHPDALVELVYEPRHDK